jgi:Fe-S-cluster containining protein
VHIEPDEVATLARIPPELRFPAPGLPDGHVVLGYDEEGRCPMLGERGCTIYDDRPRTCRTYDCRVFAAAGTTPVDDGKNLIAQRVRRWRFEIASAEDRRRRAAVRAAVAFLRAHPECLARAGGGPATSRDLAMVAMRVHDLFTDPSEEPSVEAVRGKLAM